MPIDDDTERDRRADMNQNWARERFRAKAKRVSASRPVYLDPTHSRKQVAIRVQLAAGEALAALRRQREE